MRSRYLTESRRACRQGCQDRETGRRHACAIDTALIAGVRSRYFPSPSFLLSAAPTQALQQAGDDIDGRQPIAATSRTPGGMRAPIHGAEAGLAEQRITDADDADALVRVGQAGIVAVALRFGIAEHDAVQVVDAHGQGHLGPHDVFRAGTFGSGDVADVVIAHGGIERDAVAEDQTQCHQLLRRDAIVIIALAVAGRACLCDAGTVNDATAAVTDAEQRRALQRHPARQPPLRGGAERGRRGGDAEDLRRGVVVCAVQAPYAAVIVARAVWGAVQQAAAEHAFEAVAARRDGFEVEVIERARVAVTRLAGEAVAHGVVRGYLAAIEGLPGDGRARIRVHAHVRTEVSAEAGAEIEAREYRRVVTAEDTVKTAAMGGAIEAGGGRDRRRAHFGPQPRTAAAAALQQ